MRKAAETSRTQVKQQLINSKCEQRNRMKEKLHSMRDAGRDGHKIDRFDVVEKKVNGIFSVIWK